MPGCKPKGAIARGHPSKMRPEIFLPLNSNMAGPRKFYPGRFIDLDHPELELTDLFRTHILRLPAKVLGKSIDMVGIGVDRANGHVAKLPLQKAQSL